MSTSFRRLRPSALSVVLAALLALSLTTHIAQSEEDPVPDGPMPGMTPEMMKLTQPNEHHEAMAFFEGTWDVKMALTMQIPGMEGMPPGDGVATFAWKIPGRWMEQELKGTLMGQPYHGYGLHGFDVMRKNHVTAWVSNGDTGMVTTRGVVVDPKGETTCTYGTLDEWMTGEYGKPLKVITRKTGEDTFVLEIWDLGIGAAGQMVLKYDYTRRVVETD